MTAIPFHKPKNAAGDLIDYAIEAHGARRVLFRAVVALLGRGKKPLNVAALNAHMRRDIGLPVEQRHEPLRGPYLF